MSNIPFGQILITGITMGLIYIMVALGLTLVFGVMRIVNFVHGEFVMLAAFSMYYLYGVWHMNFVLGFFISAAAVSLVGILFQRYLYKPLKYDMDNVMIAALGASFAIKSAGWIGFGPVPRHIRTVFPGMMQFLRRLPFKREGRGGPRLYRAHHRPLSPSPQDQNGESYQGCGAG